MVAGHTKFSCDRHFGLIEKRYILSKIDTMEDVERVVRASSQGYNVPQVVKSAGEHCVKTFNWVKYFNSRGFVSIPYILKYHSFHCDTAHPRCVLVKEYSDLSTNEGTGN